MNVDRLMHPENITNLELQQILESLCIVLPQDLTREQLIEIFKKVAVPLPQRSVCQIQNYSKKFIEPLKDSEDLCLDHLSISQNCGNRHLRNYSSNDLISHPKFSSQVTLIDCSSMECDYSDGSSFCDINSNSIKRKIAPQLRNAILNIKRTKYMPVEPLIEVTSYHHR